MVWYSLLIGARIPVAKKDRMTDTKPLPRQHRKQ